VFHKRNPQGSFPGASFPGQEQPQNAPVNPYTPRSAAVRPYVSTSAASQTRPGSLNNNNHSTSTEGQRAMNAQNNENNAPQTSTPTARADIPGAMPYGRPASPAMGGAYGATNPMHAAYNPYGSGRKLIIGEGITMSGEIEHCDHLIVEGTVQATLKDAKLLDISEAGVFYGTVDIEEATIAGRFEGDIHVAGRLTVKSTGVITGSIRYKELAIEAGATIDGTLSPSGPRKADDNIAAADFSKGKAVAKQARDSANQGKPGEQLPFDANKAVNQ